VAAAKGHGRAHPVAVTSPTAFDVACAVRARHIVGRESDMATCEARSTTPFIMPGIFLACVAVTAARGQGFTLEVELPG